ncbi:NAD-dependent protein deacetylase of SIR2 family [Dickeya zeae]|uniref:NAD-dependent protein deacetylase of SIR2 family n=1 Tax=Dickeya zeae TaxID=204042 RepID=A0AAE7CY45_9GAMM|nr:NAD-dependent protein deacetylase of SIR2 family [Dickeya zeae]QIZ50511.1 NAD-dependent protein deacetylase of SIR2 family [Dickeya zeae]
MPSLNSDILQRIRNLLASCDAILIGAGAGLTASAGIDYLDEKAFSRYFQGWVNKGFTAQYELMGYRNWTQLEKWGYYKTHLSYVYYSQPFNQLYRALYQLVKNKDYFVMTSNVDGHFYKNGFDRSKLYAPQGDYGLIQCTKPCSQDVWDIKPFLDRMEPYFDKKQQILTSTKGVPKCPHCGSDMFVHVRVDNSFIDEIHVSERQKLLDWLEGANKKNLLIFDLGSGFNTPMVIRIPMERITQALPNSTLVRINSHHVETSLELGERYIPIKSDIGNFIHLMNY